MQICSLYIRNFKSIYEVKIEEMDNAMILIGKNNTGKTVILDAILALTGEYEVKSIDFNQPNKNIVIGGKLKLFEEDLHRLHERGIVSRFKNYELWEKDFQSKVPSYQEGELTFECVISRDGKKKYGDGIKTNNIYIKQIMPNIYYIDHNRETIKIEKNILEFQGQEELKDLRENICIFDRSKKCNRCFHCIGIIEQKYVEELNVFETTRLLEYKLIQLKMNDFTEQLNKNFKKNGGGLKEIQYVMDFDVDKVFAVRTNILHKDRKIEGKLETLGTGFKSIYILSLLETYIEQKAANIGSIIMLEDPEIFLHSQLQKVASEILYKLSKKNQVIFSTHSPNMIFNFSQKQIKQVVVDENYHTIVNENEDIDCILDDLGYTANDFMNVNFVFIVEGKQDSNRLPLLLEKYYSEIYDEGGKLQRISIVPTNSCTNIKTYANLKYINKLYLKEQFLMIRDSDGKNPNQLKKQLCSYYSERAEQDVNNLPRVTEKNILILKYYSFENYFLDPKTMSKIGIIKNEEEFYNTLYTKYKDYLFKLGSTKRMLKATGIRINSKQDLRKHIETVKIYVRGHNLYDIFYGRYRGSREEEILRRYIEEAPKEIFKDILEAIDNFIYFENRRRNRTK